MNNNVFYNYSGSFIPGVLARAENVAAEFQSVQAGFALLSFQGSDAGLANAYVVTTTGAPIATYANGQQVQFQPVNANTGASTVNVNSIGAVPLMRFNGTSLQSGDLVAGAWYTAIYNSSLSGFTVSGPAVLATIPGTISLSAPTYKVGLVAAGGVSTAAAPIDATYAIDQSIAPTWTSAHTWTVTQAANTSVDGIVLLNSTAASSGNQQYSPRIRLSGQGWGTTAPGSQQTDWKIECRPVQGTSPIGSLIISSSVNLGAYNDQLKLFSSTGATFLGTTSATACTVTGTTNPGNGINLAATNTLGLYTNSVERAFIDANGMLNITNTEPRETFIQSGAGTDAKNWDIDVASGVLSMRTRTDADAAGKTWLSVSRGSTTTISSISLGNATDNPTGSWLGTGTFAFNGSVTIAGQSGQGLNVTAVSGAVAGAFAGNSSSGNSFGVTIQAGTTTADFGLRINSQTNSLTYLLVRGDGQVQIGSASANAVIPLVVTATSAGLAANFVTGDNANIVQLTAGATNGGNITFNDGTTARGYVGFGASTMSGGAITDLCISAGAGGAVNITRASVGVKALTVGSVGNVTIAAPSAGVGLTVSSASGQPGIATSTIQCNGAAVTASSGAINYGGTTATTASTTAGGFVLPALAAGYAIINVAGTQMKLPYYAN